jgi:DNA-binding CsgD family transcriptional regulator
LQGYWLNAHVCEKIHHGLPHIGIGGRARVPNRMAQLFNFSQREKQAVELLLLGLSNKEIANRMNISPNTVNTFFRLIMIKMGVSSRSGILARMIRAGLSSAPFDRSVHQP